MKKRLALLSVLIITFDVTFSLNIIKKKFDEFKTKYSKEYENEEDRQKHFETFKKNLVLKYRDEIFLSKQSLISHKLLYQ